MLVIRQDQFSIFREDLDRRFEERLAWHVRRYFPRTAAKLAGFLPLAVRDCMNRGRNYGFRTHRELGKFTNLVFVFGRDFDHDPACAWAHDLLRGSLPGPPKMSRLYDAARAHEAEGRGYFAQEEQHG